MSCATTPWDPASPRPGRRVRLTLGDRSRDAPRQGGLRLDQPRRPVLRLPEWRLRHKWCRFADAPSRTPPSGGSAPARCRTRRVLQRVDQEHGYKGQIYFANEEYGDNGRVFGITKEGDATRLPRLGLFSWENTTRRRTQSDTTLVMGQEDGPTATEASCGSTSVRSSSSGPPVAKAGLTNGDDQSSMRTTRRSRRSPVPDDLRQGEPAGSTSSTTNGTRQAPPRTPTRWPTA